VFDSSASHGQWLNCDMRRWAWAWAVNPLSESLFMTRVRCSIPICVALSRMGGRPIPASFRGFCMPSEGKFGRRPIACLIALFRIPSMVVSCLSLNTPRCVACYLDFNSCSIANDFRGGLSSRFARALASFLTSLMMWRKCFLKSSMGLMWNPSILYDLFGERYFMWGPSTNVMICSCSVVWLLWLRGLPSPQSDPVDSHFEVSSWSPVYWLKRCSFLSCILRFYMVPVAMLMSSAYPWSS